MRFSLFILAVTSISAFAQPKPLFKIISCSEGVSVDGTQIIPGDIVYSNSNKLNIPEKGYLGILTIQGHTHLLTKSSKVVAVDKEIKARVERRSRGIGAIHRPIPDRFKIAGDANIRNSEIFGDSIIIAFKSHYKSLPPFKLTFLNMHDERISEYEINQTWKVFSTDTLFKREEAIMYQISSGNKTENEILPFIKKITPTRRQRLNSDFQRLNKNAVMQLAFFEINRLYYDHIFQLYKMETSKTELVLDEFLSAYLARTKAKYRLQEYITK
jgi:hypothetical protein